MLPHLGYVFIDGGYLRVLARQHGGQLANPLALSHSLIRSGQIQSWACDPRVAENTFLGRINYYDAMPDDPAHQRPELEDYWKAIALMDDVHLGFGALRGLKRKVRQKGVDTLIAVDMLVGSFSALFDIAILVAGDADFVPVVEEVKRRGVMVAVSGSLNSMSEDLRRAADRFIDIQPSWLPSLLVHGKAIAA